MNKAYFTQKVKEFIANGDIEDALQMGIDYASDFSFVLLSGRFYRLKKDFDKGLISQEGYKVETNRLMHSLLNEVDEGKIKIKEHKSRKIRKIIITIILALLVDWKRIFNIVLYLILATTVIVGINEFVIQQKQNKVRLHNSPEILVEDVIKMIKNEIELQKKVLIKEGFLVTDSTRFSISNSLIDRVAGLCEFFLPYYRHTSRTIKGYSITVTSVELRPEQKLLFYELMRLPLDRATLKKIFERNDVEMIDLRDDDTFHHSDFFGAFLVGANLRGANLIDLNLNEANLIGADLTGANLTKVNLIRADLTGANLMNTHFFTSNQENNCKLDHANLRGVNLMRADLFQVSLFRANLGEANLREANLKFAMLRGAFLNYADLREADLTGADLREADLTGADLGETDLTGASLTRADLSAASNLTLQQLANTDNLFECKLPNYIDVEKLKNEHPELFRNPWDN